MDRTDDSGDKHYGKYRVSLMLTLLRDQIPEISRNLTDGIIFKSDVFLNHHKNSENQGFEEEESDEEAYFEDNSSDDDNVAD